MRAINLKEMNNSYYENAANIKTIVEYENYEIDVNGRKAYHIQNIVYYKNGWFQINDFNLMFSSIFPNEELQEKFIKEDSLTRTRKMNKNKWYGKRHK